MNNALRVKDLFEFLKGQMAKGHENYTLFVTDDEEANGYHALWYNGQEANKYSDEDRTFIEDVNCDISILDNKDEAIYLG